MEQKVEGASVCSEIENVVDEDVVKICANK